MGFFKLLRFGPFKYLSTGMKFLNNPHYLEIQDKNNLETSKAPSRTEIINFLLSLYKHKTTYLEIGVRNPADNYNHILADTKYSVDPGVEFKENPADFKMTSDEFFEKLSKNEILSADLKFDVIFIDGLHLADQVDRDISNALRHITDDGYIVLHDCNPPSEWHARESFRYDYTPARGLWNGTTWKAFLKWRFEPSIHSCCIDSDWGVGILSKKNQIGVSIENENPFFEYHVLQSNRKKYLNLMDFVTFKTMVKKQAS